MVRTRVALAALLVALLAAGPAAADPAQHPAQHLARDQPVLPIPVIYQLPVPGPVIDPYRPPSTPYGPGNRGIDYGTTPGEVVVAPADGVVTFAGAVAGALHVVLLHGDGIRTSLSFLSSILVTRGQQVVRGQAVGLAGSSVHFGARRGEAYLDPSTLLTGAVDVGSRSVLVADGPDRPLGIAEEAAGLSRLLAGAVTRADAPGAADLATTARTAAAVSSQGVVNLARMAAASGAPAAWAVMAGAARALAARALAGQEPCTPTCRSGPQLLADAAGALAADPAIAVTTARPLPVP